MTTVNGSLLRDAVWWRWSAAAGCARLPQAMASLASIFAGRAVSGSYAFGALLAGCYALCESVGAPWRGRALGHCPPDRRTARMRNALLLSAAGLVGLAVAVQTRQHAAVLVALTVLAAVSSAGVPGGYRALLTEIVEPARLLPALSWDATLLEVEWLVGPLLVALAVAGGRPAAAYLVMAGWALAGALLTALVPTGADPPASPATGAPTVTGAPTATGASTVTGAPTAPRGPTAPGVPTAGGAWRNRAGWPSYLTSAGLGVAEGGFIAALPAVLVGLETGASAAGVFAGLLALASMLGGIGLTVLQARLTGEPGRLADGALLLACCLLATAALAPSAPWLVLPVLAGGLFIAPVNALRSKALEQALPVALRSEGYSIQYGANGIGVALGSALVAAVVGHSASLAMLAVLGIPAVASATSLAAGRRRAAV